MNIGPDTVVVFHYTLRDESGTELETSRGSDPNAYLHGANNIVPGLEKAMAGKTSGDVFSATVEPEGAYGQPNPDKQQRVPIKHLLFKGKLKAGMVVQLNTSVDILIQVNLGEEETKSGTTADELVALVSQVARLNHLRIRGLMVLPPWHENPEAVRPFVDRTGHPATGRGRPRRDT